MSLFTPEIIQTERNIDLTDPNGKAVAEALINATTAYVSRYVGYPIEQAEQTSYFSDGYSHVWLPTGAPVSSLSLSRKSGGGYTDIPSNTYDWSESGEIESTFSWPSGLKAVKAVYTAGWTENTLPGDLRDAMIDMVTLKLQQIANFSASTTDTTTGEGEEEEGGSSEVTTPPGQLKKYSVDGYTEEYSTAQTDAFWKARSAQLAKSIGDNIPSSIKEVMARYRKPFAI